jgi:hypothetical protein
MLSLPYIAAERTWTYSKYISCDRYPARLLVRLSGLQKRQLRLLLRVVPCLQSCCLANRLSNSLQYVLPLMYWHCVSKNFNFNLALNLSPMSLKYHASSCYDGEIIRLELLKLTLISHYNIQTNILMTIIIQFSSLLLRCNSAAARSN